MNKLFDKQKKYIWKYFKDISEIPRGSGNTELIIEYLVRFAKKRDLRYIHEPCGNVIIFKGCMTFILQKKDRILTVHNAT